MFGPFRGRNFPLGIPTNGGVPSPKFLKKVVTDDGEALLEIEFVGTTAFGS
jgi:hypothetical protein